MSPVDAAEMAKRVAALERAVAASADRERILAARVEVTERATGELAWALFARAKAAALRGRLPATAAALWRHERHREKDRADQDEAALEVAA